MTNDLISREALKKEIANLVVGGEEKLKDYYENGSKLDENAWLGGIYDAWELIEDAPTVEPTFGVFKAICCEACEKRPQGGKWITIHFEPNALNAPEKSKLDFVQCPFCESIHQGRHNFCSRCGADMRGDE